ncbi:hypothetical protein SPAN111604_15240 [Sphingomonas antarctica]|uniref:polysaccharide deacetylase family protein n=1 Tax=Sphingomonas antarctica TaxID=2040274 RepID=UPI0039EA01A5
MSSKLAALLAAAMVLFAGAEARAKRATIAITFDDLPALTILPDQRYVTYLNAVILRGLKRYRIPATGFVNEAKLDELDREQQIAILKRWVDASMGLG